MPTRRQFFCATALGVGTIGLSRAFGATPAPTEVGAPPLTETSLLDQKMAHLVTAEQRGVSYLHDSLSTRETRPSKLLIRTELSDTARCGRRSNGWSLNAGSGESYTRATLRDAPVLGNRSQWAQFSFRSTQEGITPGEHGLVEMQLARGTTSEDLPLRVCVDNGRFYILGLNGDRILAGDRTKSVCQLSAKTVYTLTTLLVEKAVYARLSGPDLPGGGVELVVPDRNRFIPGRPGFALRTNPRATSGSLSVTDWSVSPVGPAQDCLLAVIGDSITAGNDQEPEAESYVHLVTRQLGQEIVLNTGSGGSTTTIDLGRFPFEIAPFKPTTVWIEGGTNDIGNGASAETAFAAMMRQTELATWTRRVMFSTVPPRLLPSDERDQELIRLNRLIRESGKPYVDRHALVRDPRDPRRLRPDLDHRDHIHITPLGHSLIAGEATRIIATLG